MATATLPGTEECNCFALRSAARQVTQIYDQFLAPTGLRVTQFSILAKLRRKGALTINELADEMAMDRTTLGRAIQPLERDGLISIEPSASDRRAKAQARFETEFGTSRASELRALLRAVVGGQPIR